jgi:hypothetical protein
MVTKTKPKGWKQESSILKAVPPAHLPRSRRPNYIVTKKVRLELVKAHIPKLSKAKRDEVVEGIEGAVRKFLFAANIDGRPLPANIRARMESLEKTAKGLLQELRDCDDLSWEVITRKADTTPPPPSPKPRKDKGKRKLSDDLHVPLEIGPMDPPDRIVEQLEQYALLFSKVAKNAGNLGDKRKRTAFPTLIHELNSVWNTATGQSGKGNSKFTDFAVAVANTKSVRAIIPPVADQRRKIQRAIK